jgi:hypothetical protein
MVVVVARANSANSSNYHNPTHPTLDIERIPVTMERGSRKEKKKVVLFTVGGPSSSNHSGVFSAIAVQQKSFCLFPSLCDVLVS